MSKFIPIDSELTENEEKESKQDNNLVQSINIIEKLLRKILEKAILKIFFLIRFICIIDFKKIRS